MTLRNHSGILFLILLFVSLAFCSSFAPLALTNAASQPITLLKYEKIAWVWSVAAGDINGDGLIEIVAGTKGGVGEPSPVVTAIKNDGNVLWTFNVPETVNAWTVVTADIDNDHSDEIIAGKYFYGPNMEYGNILAIDGDSSVLWSYMTEGYINSIIVDDINGDGKKEVLAAGEDDDRVYCLTHDGSLLWSVSLTGDLRNRNALAVGDVDGDSRKEVVIGTCSTSDNTVNAVTVIKNDGAVLWSMEMIDWVESVAVGDIDGDGRKEVVAGLGLRMSESGQFSGEPLQVLSHTGEFLWSFPIAIRVFDVALGDLDGDGAQEIIAGSEEGKVYVLKGNGTPFWSYTTADSSGFVHEVEVQDVNGDGEEEVIAASYDYNVYVIHSSGRLLWQSEVGLYTELAFADVNNDGIKDLVAGVMKPSGLPGPGQGIVYVFITAVQEGGASTVSITDPGLVSSSNPLVVDAVDESGVKVFISEISAETTIEIKKISNPSLTESLSFNSVIVDSPISISSDVKVSGTFKIRIYYSSLPFGVDESALSISYWDQNTGRWVEAESSVNTAEKYVETTTNHLSYWVVIGNAIWFSWWFILSIIVVACAVVGVVIFKLKRKHPLTGDSGN
jgi:hypothetical protein